MLQKFASLNKIKQMSQHEVSPFLTSRPEVNKPMRNELVILSKNLGEDGTEMIQASTLDKFEDKGIHKHTDSPGLSMHLAQMT